MDIPRHTSVQRLVLPQPALSVAEVSSDLWQSLAAELVLIIGDGGFGPLYIRSVQLSSVAYPWLKPLSEADLMESQDSRFSNLNKCLGEQDASHASQASAVLLNTFIDMLARLIGETLTVSILRSAWAHTPFDIVGKDLSSS